MNEECEVESAAELRCRFTFDFSFQKRWRIAPWWVVLIVVGLPLLGALVIHFI